MKRKKQHVLVGILTQECMIHGSLAWIAAHLPVWSAESHVPYQFSFWIEAGNSPQAYKRNVIIEKALSLNADICVQIDDDMIVSGDALLRLLSTPGYDIVAPLQYTMKGIDPSKGRNTPEVFPCAFNIDKANGGQMLPVWPKTGDIAEVDIVGSGVIAIRRTVLDDPAMLNECAESSPPAYFRDVYQGNGRRTCGLDVDFCKRAKANGHTVLINWSVEVGHFKRVCLNDIDLYAKAQFALGYGVGRKNDDVRVESNESREEEGVAGVAGP